DAVEVVHVPGQITVHVDLGLTRRDLRPEVRPRVVIAVAVPVRRIWIWTVLVAKAEAIPDAEAIPIARPERMVVVRIAKGGITIAHTNEDGCATIDTMLSRYFWRP